MIVSLALGAIVALQNPSPPSRLAAEAAATLQHRQEIRARRRRYNRIVTAPPRTAFDRPSTAPLRTSREAAQWVRDNQLYLRRIQGH